MPARPRCPLVWTAGSSPNPPLGGLDLPKQRGRIAVDATLRVEGWPEVWSLGDCAAIPEPAEPGTYHPPTAQHASREGSRLAANILAVVAGQPPQRFRFRTLGLLALIGPRTGVARVLGMNFSGFFAWWLWRMIYLSKLPGFEKKIRVALEWTLDVFFRKDFVLHQRDTRRRDLFPTQSAPLEVRAQVCVPEAPGS